MQSRWEGPFGAFPRSDTNPNMRIGDAERNQIAEQLSKHYSDGRLDAAEFQERLDKAMSAKTRSDLSGLLADLPSLQTPEQAAGSKPQPYRRPRVIRTVIFVLIAFWALSFFAASTHFLFFGWIHIPWLLIALVALFLWSRDRRHRRWRYRRQFLDERPQ